MKFDAKTLTVLKNFASINSGVVLQKGKVQKTIAGEKSILCEAILDDEMPAEFGIYDLNRFLGNLTTLKNPEIEFNETSVIMDDGELSMVFHACSPTLIIVPPEKQLKFKQVDAKFKLTEHTLQKLLRLAAMNSLPNLSVIGKDGELLLMIHETANDTSNYGTIKIGDYAGKDFKATFNRDNLKIIPGDYDVEVEIGRFAKFVNSDGSLIYHISLEK